MSRTSKAVFYLAVFTAAVLAGALVVAQSGSYTATFSWNEINWPLPIHYEVRTRAVSGTFEQIDVVPKPPFTVTLTDYGEYKWDVRACEKPLHGPIPPCNSEWSDVVVGFPFGTRLPQVDGVIRLDGGP